MPNICEFEMLIKGSVDNLKKANEIINADYEYDENGLKSCNADFHVCRTWPYSDLEHELDFESGSIKIYGDCAWSVSTCMFEQGYYKDLKHRSNSRVTTIPIMSEMYDLDFEIYSKEYGMCFQEHYIVRKGEIELDECVEFSTEYIEGTDEYISVGGIKNWEFSI